MSENYKIHVILAAITFLVVIGISVLMITEEKLYTGVYHMEYGNSYFKEYETGDVFILDKGSHPGLNWDIWKKSLCDGVGGTGEAEISVMAKQSSIANRLFGSGGKSMKIIELKNVHNKVFLNLFFE